VPFVWLIKVWIRTCRWYTVRQAGDNRGVANDHTNYAVKPINRKIIIVRLRVARQ